MNTALCSSKVCISPSRTYGDHASRRRYAGPAASRGPGASDTMQQRQLDRRPTGSETHASSVRAHRIASWRSVIRFEKKRVTLTGRGENITPNWQPSNSLRRPRNHVFEKREVPGNPKFALFAFVGNGGSSAAARTIYSQLRISPPIVRERSPWVIPSCVLPSAAVASCPPCPCL